MSLANLLVPNNYNIICNSETINNVAANPGSTNTLWSNSAFSPPHLYWGSTDLQSFSPATLTNNQVFVPAETGIFADNVASNNWLFVKDTDGLPVMELTSVGTAANLILKPVWRQSISGGSSGFQLTSFTVIYRAVNTITSATATLTSVQFTNNATNTIAPVPITGSFTLASSANTYASTFTVNTPAYLAANQTYNLVLTFNLPSTNKVRVYGVFINFTNSS